MAKSPPARADHRGRRRATRAPRATAALATHRSALLEHGVAGRTAAFVSDAGRRPGSTCLRGRCRPAARGDGARPARRLLPGDARECSLRRRPARGERRRTAGGAGHRPVRSRVARLDSARGRRLDRSRDGLRFAADRRRVWWQGGRRAGREPAVGRCLDHRPRQGCWPSRCSARRVAPASWRSRRGRHARGRFPTAGARTAWGAFDPRWSPWPPAPTLLVRRGDRSAGFAPAQSRTRFGWSRTHKAG